jgi:hypothetical protein
MSTGAMTDRGPMTMVVDDLVSAWPRVVMGAGKGEREWRMHACRPPSRRGAQHEVPYACHSLESARQKLESACGRRRRHMRTDVPAASSGAACMQKSP